MPMTRELKKRFQAIDDRLQKIENRQPVKVYDDPSDPEFQEGLDELDETNRQRISTIEKVLQIPGVDGKLSDWRETVEVILKKLEDRLIKVELRGAWTPDEAKTLDSRVKNLWDRPSAESFKVFLTAIEDRVSKLEQIPDPHAAVTEMDERVKSLEEMARDPSSEVQMFGKPLGEWVSNMEDRVGDLERKPVAGNLSQITQKMQQEIKEHDREIYGHHKKDIGRRLIDRIDEITQSVKTLRSKVRLATWLSLLLFAMILLTLYLV